MSSGELGGGIDLNGEQKAVLHIPAGAVDLGA
jgi:hypothetical protein